MVTTSTWARNSLSWVLMYVCMHVAIGCLFSFTIIGNFGPYLSDSGSVYITRNGGLTWEKVMDNIYMEMWMYPCMSLHMHSMHTVLLKDVANERLSLLVSRSNLHTN